MTLRELHERIAATTAAAWKALPAGPGFGGGGAMGGAPASVPAEPAAAAPASATSASVGVASAVSAEPRATEHAADHVHLHRAVLRADVDVVLTWGLRESPRDYFEPWLGNLGRMTEVRCDRVLLDVLWRGSLVDRVVGLAFAEHLLPFPRSRAPRVKGLADRFFARDDAPLWRLAHELTFPDGVAFDRIVHRSGLRVE